MNSPDVPRNTLIGYKRPIYPQSLFRVKLRFEVWKGLSQQRGLLWCPWPKIVTSLILVLLTYASWLPPSIPDTAAFHFCCLCNVCAVWFRVLWDEMYYVNINFYFQSLSVAIKGLTYPAKQGFTPRVRQTDAAPGVIWRLVGSCSGGNFFKLFLEVSQCCSVPQHSGSFWTRILNVHVKRLLWIHV